jgi:hypothetical protein
MCRYTCEISSPLVDAYLPSNRDLRALFTPISSDWSCFKKVVDSCLSTLSGEYGNNLLPILSLHNFWRMFINLDFA